MFYMLFDYFSFSFHLLGQTNSSFKTTGCVILVTFLAKRGRG